MGETFEERFNRLLGDKIGKPLTPPGDRVKKMAPSAQAAVKMAIARKTPQIRKAAKSATKRPIARKKKTTDEDKDKSVLTEVQKKAFILARDKEKLEKEDKPWYEDVIGGVLSGGSDVLSAISGPLDVIARPGYAVMEGMRNTVESINKGEPVWSLTDDFASGAVSGIWGTRKTNYGDVLKESFSNPNPDEAPRAARQLGFGSVVPYVPDVFRDINASWGPQKNEDGTMGSNVAKSWGPFSENIAETTQNLVGATGTVVFDPTTYVTAGAATRIADAAKGGMAARDLARGVDAVKIAAREAMEKEVSQAARVAKVQAKGQTAWQTGEEYIMNSVYNRLEKNVHSVAGGPQKGKLIVSDADFATIAQDMTEAAKYPRLFRAQRTSSRYLRGMTGTGQKMTSKQLNNARKASPEFRVWHDEFVRTLRGTKKVTLARIQVAEKKANKALTEVFTKESQELKVKLVEHLSNATRNVPTLHFAGYKVAEFPRIAKQWQKATKNFKGTRFGEQWQKAFNYSSNFPGKAAHLISKAHRRGVIRFEKLQKEATEVASLYTRKERIQIGRMLQTGQPPSPGSPLEAGFNFLKKTYDEMWGEEMAKGIRPAPSLNPNISPTRSGSAKVKNYAYTHVYRKTTRKHIDDWTDARKVQLNRTGDIVGFTTDDAIKAGLKVEQDPFINILYRKAKSNRKLVRNDLYTDFVDHYAIRGLMSNEEQAGRNLIRVDKKKYPTPAHFKPGEELYIDKNIKEYFDKFTDLQAANSKEGGDLLRTLDFITRKFKTWNTIYFPGYHIKNFLSDFITGAMDGVTIKHYRELMTKWPKKTTANLTLGSNQVSYETLLCTYLERAASGQIQTDLGSKLLGGAGFRGVKNAAGAPSRALRAASEIREDWGRFAHFYHAMDQEYAAGIARGMKHTDAYEHAIEPALLRVNKYKLDYSALTKIESTVMRRGIPFYTFLRKITPTLLESIALQPAYMNTFVKLENQFAPGEDTLLPDWLREMGYMELGRVGGSNPGEFGMTNDLLPTGILDSAFSNPVPSSHPLLQMLIEAQTDKDLFTGAPLPGNDWEQIVSGVKDNFAVGRVQDMVHDNNWRKTLGAPFRTNTETYKNQKYQDIADDVRYKIRKVDDLVKDLGYHIFLSQRKGDQSIRIRDETTGKTVLDAKDLGEVQEWISTVTAAKAG